MKKIVGVVLLAIPFLAIFTATVMEHGWFEAVVMWGKAIIFTATIMLGIKLMVED